jgi:branched-chain amino acid transport system permease protein
MAELIVTLFEGVSLGGTYALIALGIIIIFRATHTFNFAHGEFMLLAAYLVAKWQTEWHVPVLLTTAVGLAVVAAVGWLLFRIVLQRIVGASTFVGVIATLGFAAMADGIMSIIFGPGEYNITYSFLPSGSWVWDGAHVSKEMVVLAIVDLVVAGAAAAYISYTRVGARVRAAGQDALLASQGAINVHRIYAGSWAVGCALAGFAGIVYGASNVVSTDITSLGLVAFPAILLGGLDSIGGSIVGGIIVGMVQAFTATYLGGQWIDVTAYSLLLVVILLKPSGLFGTETVVRV